MSDGTTPSAPGGPDPEDREDPKGPEDPEGPEDPAGSADDRSSPADAGSSQTRRPLWLAGIAAGLTFLAMFGIWNRQQNESAALDSPAAPAGLFQQSQAQGTSLVSVGRVTGMAIPCTAWLLDTGGQPEDPAYAVMAGRCTGIDDSATVLSAVPVDGARVAFNSFASLTTAVQLPSVPVPIEEVTWASTRGTDLALVRLGTTLGDLAEQGIAPIRPVAPLAEGGQILVASVPVEGIASDQQHLRGSRCAVGATTGVAEGAWLFADMQASDCEGMLEGSAGSPAFNPAGEAVGMVTTTTIAAPQGADCALDRPCAVGAGTVAFQQDTSYLVDVQGLGACFEEGTFTRGADCPLEDPAGVVVASVRSTTVPAGGPVPVQLQDPAGEPLAVASVLAKAGTLGAVDCWDPKDWAPVAVVEGQAVVTAPAQQGLAVLCVGSAAQPTPLVVTVSGSAPDASAIQLEQVPVADGVQVAPIADPPQYSRFSWLVEPGGSTDCATAEGYTQFTGEPAVIQAADLPATVCVIAYDDAGAASVPTAFTVE